MPLDPETTAATGVTVTGILGGFVTWFRSLGTRITKLENRVDNITDVEKSPFVLTRTFNKACEDLEGKIGNVENEMKEMNKNISGGFKTINKTLNEFECLKKMKEKEKHND